MRVRLSISTLFAVLLWAPAASGQQIITNVAGGGCPLVRFRPTVTDRGGTWVLTLDACQLALPQAAETALAGRRHVEVPAEAAR
jgi:hypothetical protein